MYQLNPLIRNLSVETMAKLAGTAFLLLVFLSACLVTLVVSLAASAVGAEHTVRFQDVVEQPTDRVHVTVVGGDEAVYQMLRYEMTDLLQVSPSIEKSLTPEQRQDAVDNLARIYHRRHVINQFLDIQFVSVYDNPALASKSPCIQFHKHSTWVKLPKPANWDTGDGLAFFEWIIRCHCDELYQEPWVNQCDMIQRNWEEDYRLDRCRQLRDWIDTRDLDGDWYSSWDGDTIYSYTNGYEKLEVDLPVWAPPTFPEKPPLPPCPLGDCELFDE